MTNEEKFTLISRNLEEVLTPEELKSLIASGIPLKHYIGFEISGKVHIGQGLLSMLKVKDLHDAGAETIIFLADWHTWINKKLDCTLETATRMAKDYFEEALKAAYLAVGGNPDDLKFVLGSELYDKTYWSKVISVSKATTISRMMRSTDITGRTAGESSDAAILIYPAMQAADIFQMGVNIAHAGTDQRNVHVVARDVAKDFNQTKPIAIHHHLLQGIKSSQQIQEIDDETKKAIEKLQHLASTVPLGGAMGGLSNEEKMRVTEYVKMSKSKPDTAIFITDSPEEIRRKVNNAYAPEGNIILNPVLDWTKYLIFYEPNTTFTIERQEKYGGNITYTSYEDLENDYKEKKLFPLDLKNAVAEWLIKKLEPARKYFEEPKRKSALEQIEALTNKK